MDERARLADALRERDEAIAEAARLRAELDGLRLRRADESDPPEYPSSAAPGEPPPLRYVLVDAVYGPLKRGLARLRRLR